MALNGIPISDEQCIGDSLVTLNDSFITLDSRTLSLSSGSQNLVDGVYTTMRDVSGNLNTVYQTISGNIYSLVQSTSGQASALTTSLQLSGATYTNQTTVYSSITGDNVFLKIAIGNYYKYMRLNDINGVYNEIVDPNVTPTPTLTITPTNTPTPGVTPTPTVTPTITVTPTPTVTPTITVTPSTTPPVSPSTLNTLSFLVTSVAFTPPAASDDGQYRIYTPRGGVRVSNNFGQTWSSFLVGTDITGVACSSNGSIMYAVNYSTGTKHRSTDYGASWSTLAVGGDQYTVATNETGQQAVIGLYNGDACGVTSNTGTSWSTSTATGGGTGATRNVTMDSTGNTIVTGSGYKSINSGTSWARVVTTNINSSVKISGDATKILVGNSVSDYLKLSNNGGTSFTDITSLGTKTWSKVAMTRNGTIMMARDSAGIAYLSTDGGSTWSTTSY